MKKVLCYVLLNFLLLHLVGCSNIRVSNLPKGNYSGDIYSETYVKSGYGDLINYIGITYEKEIVISELSINIFFGYISDCPAQDSKSKSMILIINDLLLDGNNSYIDKDMMKKIYFSEENTFVESNIYKLWECGEILEENYAEFKCNIIRDETKKYSTYNYAHDPISFKLTSDFFDKEKGDIYIWFCLIRPELGLSISIEDIEFNVADFSGRYAQLSYEKVNDGIKLIAHKRIKYSMVY